MDLIADNQRDFLQYCKNCHVALPDKDGYKVYVITEDTRRDKSLLRQITGEQPVRSQDVEEFSWKKILNDFTFAPPHVGLISVQQTLAYVERKPLRTYRKGFCNQLYGWRVPNYKLYISGNPYSDKNLRADAIAYRVYNPNMFTYQDLYHRLNQGELIGGAITPFVGMYVDEEHENILVCYKNKLIGYAEADRAFIAKPWKDYQDRINEEIGVPVEIAQK